MHPPKDTIEFLTETLVVVSTLSYEDLLLAVKQVRYMGEPAKYILSDPPLLKDDNESSFSVLISRSEHIIGDPVDGTIMDIVRAIETSGNKCLTKKEFLELCLQYKQKALVESLDLVVHVAMEPIENSKRTPVILILRCDSTGNISVSTTECFPKRKLPASLMLWAYKKGQI